MEKVVLLPRFREQVRLHLVANYLSLDIRPLILGIFGRPGDGKSAQLMTALDAHGVEPFRVNAADLESSLAGEPGKMVARTYSAASLEIGKGIPTAIVVDDIDTTMGEWDRNTGTVNHQQVLAELMHLADRPVDELRSQPFRVPVFVTGNDLAKLYPPLRRHRRMAAFHWQPTMHEKLQVVRTLFAEVVADGRIGEVLDAFPEESLAFYASVYQAVRERQLHPALLGFDDMRRAVMARRSFSQGVQLQRVDVDEILVLAKSIKTGREASLQNYLIASDSVARR